MEFPIAVAPNYVLAERVALVFSSTDLAPLTVHGRVLSAGQDEHGRHYLFELSAQGEETLLARSRQAFRVRPIARSPIHVTLHGQQSQHTATGTMEDISLSGIGILLALAAEQKLYSDWSVDLSFPLPGDPAPVELAGLVRHRRMHGGQIRYGIEFDAQRSPDFRAQTQKVNAYVLQRQRETMQQLRAARDQHTPDP